MLRWHFTALMTFIKIQIEKHLDLFRSQPSKYFHWYFVNFYHLSISTFEFGKKNKYFR